MIEGGQAREVDEHAWGKHGEGKGMPIERVDVLFKTRRREALEKEPELEANALAEIRLCQVAPAPLPSSSP